MRIRALLRQLSSRNNLLKFSSSHFLYHSNSFSYSQLRQPGFICRDAYNECDLPEICTGESGQCPTDVYKKNGSPCGVGASGMEKATGKRLCD